MVRPIDQASWHGIKAARQRMVLCRLMIDIMRGLHGAYAPASEPFGTRLETFFIGLCVALGELEERPFSVAKIAAYMHVPVPQSRAGWIGCTIGVSFIGRDAAITWTRGRSTLSWGCEAISTFAGCSRRLLRN
jgi:hypothetical protein